MSPGKILHKRNLMRTGTLKKIRGNIAPKISAVDLIFVLKITKLSACAPLSTNRVLAVSDLRRHVSVYARRNFVFVKLRPAARRNFVGAATIEFFVLTDIRDLCFLISLGNIFV